MGASHSGPTVGVINTPNPGMNIGAISTPQVGAITTPQVGVIATPGLLMNLSLYDDLYNPKPVVTTTSTHTHSGSSFVSAMPTTNVSQDMHTGSHSEWTTVQAPTMEGHVIDLSGTKNSGVQIFSSRLI